MRFRCAQGLETQKRRQPQNRPDTGLLLTHVEKAIGALRDRQLKGTQDTLQERDLELLFLLLGSAYEPETVALCLQALRSDDRALQGTALEYLENLVPSYIWISLQPIVAPGFSGSGKKRGLQQAANDLVAAAASLRGKRRREPSTDGM